MRTGRRSANHFRPGRNSWRSSLPGARKCDPGVQHSCVRIAETDRVSGREFQAALGASSRTGSADLRLMASENYTLSAPPVKHEDFDNAVAVAEMRSAQVRVARPRRADVRRTHRSTHSHQDPRAPQLVRLWRKRRVRPAASERQFSATYATSSANRILTKPFFAAGASSQMTSDLGRVPSASSDTARCGSGATEGRHRGALTHWFPPGSGPATAQRAMVQGGG
eukprot:scaffold477_cov355-Pinguiococcus_pyrenoidosus.AAC.9